MCAHRDGSILWMIFIEQNQTLQSECPKSNDENVGWICGWMGGWVGYGWIVF